MLTRTRRALAAVAVAVTAIALAGCSSSGSDGDSDTGGDAQSTHSQAGDTAADAPTPSAGAGDTTGSAHLSGTLRVFAAASLKATFDELRQTFMDEHPGVDFPEITYNGSSTLATQITDGAPADVFASANETNMDKVADLVTDRVDFATNTLQIAVAPGNPKHIRSLADLAKPGVITVMCAEPVPCGAAAHQALDAAGVTLTPASEEQNVTAVLTKVATGNADAGLVYQTDVATSDGTVDGVDFPEASEAVNTYPIAVVKQSSNTAAAEAFVDLVTSEQGQKVLAGVGFGAP